MSSGIPSMFKTPRHRSFDYKPMIYDEQKERKKELEQMVDEQRTGRVDNEHRAERLRGKLSDKWSASARKQRQSQSTAQGLRLLTILAALGGLIWLFFNMG